MSFSLVFGCNAFLIAFVVQCNKVPVAQENANNNIAFAGFMPKDNVSPADEKPFWNKKSENAETDVGNNL